MNEFTHLRDFWRSYGGTVGDAGQDEHDPQADPARTTNSINASPANAKAGQGAVARHGKIRACGHEPSHPWQVL